MKKSMGSQSGFTLLEVLIAAAIFAFAAMGILQMFIRCALLDQANRNKSIAATHAEAAMEYIRSQTFSTLQTKLCHNGVAVSWPVYLEPLDPAKPDSPKILDLGGIKDPTILNLSGINSGETIAATTTPECCTSLDWLDITVVVKWKDRTQANERELELKTSISK